jgi:hypothetical protein
MASKGADWIKVPVPGTEKDCSGAKAQGGERLVMKVWKKQLHPEKNQSIGMKRRTRR